MGYSRFVLPIIGQIGVFAGGILGWLAIGHGLYATSLLCLLCSTVLAGLLLAHRYRSVSSSVSAGTDRVFALELSRRRLTALLDQVPSPLLFQIEDGPIITVNRAARILFGERLAARRVTFGGSSSLAHWPSHIDWQDHRYAVNRALFDEGDVRSQLAVLNDISADVRAAEASAVRDMLSVLNHELMNVLTPVASMSKSALDIMRDQSTQSQEAAIKALERVVDRTDGLIDFVDSYRVLTRLPAPQRHKIPLAAFCEDLAQSFAAQWSVRQVRFDLVAETTGLSALMDRDQLLLCLGNLLNNAAQAALEASGPTVRLTVWAEGSYVYFLVEDSGKGIDPRHRDQVFLPFFTTKTTGTGVGLSLARQILQGHGSELVLVTETGDLPGARFRFRLMLDS